MEFNSIEELLNKTKEIVGKTFAEIDTLNLLETMKNDKGILGKIVETGFYSYPLNNRAEADFAELGVELKVSGFKKLKKGNWSAKERISLSQINYNTILNYPFEMSSVVTKSSKLLFIWYEYVKGKDKGSFVICDFQLYDLTKVEPIIKNDYILIQDKVRAGLAHKLSEGDSVILGAATKGASGQTQRQPYSEILAPTRAFSLKNSFLRGVLNEHRANYTVQSTKELTPEQWVWNKIKQYKGMTQLAILQDIDSTYILKKVPKNISDMIVKRIVGKMADLNKTNELFNKSRYMIKSIPVDLNYFPLEKATFHTLNISDFEDTWEDSEWKLFFEESTFLYISYIATNKLQVKNGYRQLDCLVKVTFTAEEVTQFGLTYNLIKEAIELGDITKLPTATLYPDAPLVISTKGNKSGAYDQFFNGENKACFMFNKDFLYNKFMTSKKWD